MERRGIDTIFYYQVDNPLVRMGDPVYLGFHDAAGAEMSCKVVRKQDAMEKVGVVARKGGRAGVIEYTELDDERRDQRDASGELVYWAGNVAIHVFTTSFVRRVAIAADDLLPFHASAKKIPTLDADGTPVKPSEPNGRKLERFVFDALPAANRVCVVEARRAEEFSPVKNAAQTDSPATARRDLVAQYRSWLEAAGIEGVPTGTAIEIDHSRIDGPEEARALGIRSVAESGDLILTAPGAKP
jgi:UDP-N-acetylglucosamine/UDP-N-acetylgalactosamine diphosphorylase